MSDKTYIAIDLKSFYASVECQELGKDPLTATVLWMTALTGAIALISLGVFLLGH